MSDTQQQQQVSPRQQPKKTEAPNRTLEVVAMVGVVAVVILIALFVYRNTTVYGLGLGPEVNIDDGTLFVNTTDNRVGIKNKTPVFPFDVTGDVNTTGKLRENGYALIPEGTIVMWTGTIAPNGWALCDGDNGTPDLRGRFVIAYGQGSGLTNRAYGATGGAETHTLTVNEIPGHTHTGTTASDGTHTHTQTTINDDFNNTGSYPNYNTPSFAQHDGSGSITWPNINSNGAHTHTFTTDSTGGGLPHNNMPPFYALAYIMKL